MLACTSGAYAAVMGCAGPQALPPEAFPSSENKRARCGRTQQALLCWALEAFRVLLYLVIG